MNRRLLLSRPAARRGRPNVRIVDLFRHAAATGDRRRSSAAGSVGATASSRADSSRSAAWLAGGPTGHRLAVASANAWMLVMHHRVRAQTCGAAAAAAAGADDVTAAASGCCNAGAIASGAFGDTCKLAYAELSCDWHRRGSGGLRHTPGRSSPHTCRPPPSLRPHTPPASAG